MIFRDRSEAGRKLGERLRKYAGRPDLLVLGLPRGGLPVAYEVATALDSQLDVFTVRKLGVPGQEELAMGAIASGGVRVLNQDVLSSLSIPDSEIESVAEREARELERREHTYRGGRQQKTITSRCVIVVDDGLATGSSMRAAVKALRLRNPSKIVVAIPVAPLDTCELLRQEADEVYCEMTPRLFFSVGEWYDDFSQISDQEVREIYDRAAQRFDVN